MVGNFRGELGTYGHVMIASVVTVCTVIDSQFYPSDARTEHTFFLFFVPRVAMTMALSLTSCCCAVLYVLLLSVPFDVTASSAGVSRAASRSEDPSLPLLGLKPDPFVMAAPLVVAAVCKDGVAIVATHTASSKEPLLMDETIVENSLENVTAEDSATSNSSDSTQAPLPLDLPLSFRGPFRIQTIDGFGTTLAFAGWRTDGEMLASRCRSLAASELDRFGEPTNGVEYGRFLAEEASSWMARCAVSENVSCY
jgi:hypothetical protein